MIWRLVVTGWVLTAQTAPEPERILTAARAVFASARYCFLVTVDEQNRPQARLMEPFEPTGDFTVWFGTHPGSRKVAQLKKKSQAAVACYDPAGPNALTLLGKARLVEDPLLRRRYWRPGWEKFFPGGPGGANYLLIEFTPERIELISNTHGIANQPATPLPAIIERHGTAWRLPASRRPN